MQTTFTLSIEEILKNPLFNHTEIIAGKDGLQRNVRWIHILEVMEVETLVHGNEMILSTGLGFTDNQSKFVSYLKKLIELQCACLCLEVGQYLQYIPDEVKQIADSAQFPIILFTKKVRFVDITREIHGQIINHHYNMLQNLEKVSREFHRLTLKSQGTLNVLKLLRTNTQSQIIYLPIQKTPRFIPHTDKRNDLIEFLQTRLLNLKQNEEESIIHIKYKEETVLVRPLGALGQIWAYLCLVKETEPSEYDLLLLDSASISIAQDLLKNRFMEERQLHSENLWVNDLIHNRLRDDIQVQTQLGQDFRIYSEWTYQVCILEIHEDQEAVGHMNLSESARLQISMIVRSIFEKFLFRPFITMKNNSLVILAFNLEASNNSRISLKIRLEKILNEVITLVNEERSNTIQLFMGVGSSYKGLRNAFQSYEEASKALFLKSHFSQPIVLYDELGAFQLLLNLKKDSLLESYILRHLGPLIEEDKNKKSDLLYTLKIYLDYNGSKKLAAEHLHIVRQSLYYRLEKIRELIGEDFMLPEKRLALQLAIIAYDLIEDK